MESVVKHVPNTYYLELRQDYITLCQSLTYRKSEKSKSSPYCKALILAIMEKWTNEKVRKKKDPHIYMTYAQWSEEMYGMFGRWVILDSLDELAEEELIIRQKCRINGRESYSYLLNAHYLNKKLAELPRLQIDATGANVDATDLQVDVTDLEIDGSSSSPASKSRHFIESTQNQSIKSEKESTTARSTFFTSEELKMDTLYCHHYEEPLSLTKKLKSDYAKLIPHVETQEDMDSLIEYTEGKIKGDDPRAYPGNLVRWVNSWKVWRQKKRQEEEALLPWSPPDTSLLETPEPAQVTHRQHMSLPVDMREWMIDTAREFGGDELACVNELEWCFQHTGCTEEEFYTKLITAYERARRDGSMETLFMEFKQMLALIVEAVS